MIVLMLLIRKAGLLNPLTVSWNTFPMERLFSCPRSDIDPVRAVLVAMIVLWEPAQGNAHLHERLVKVISVEMAASSSTGTAVDGQSLPAVAVGGTLVLNSVKWDPFSSPDWDNEKHTREALVRIKR